MDNMLEHPWIELQVLIKEKWLTQKAFASILWKKVSEVNELLKWKRNITIQRDYLLHQVLWTPIKYRILKQIDYDYSLLDIEETDETWIIPSPGDWKSHKSSLSGEDLDGVWRGLGWGSEDKGEVSSHNNVILSDSEESIDANISSWASAKDLRWEIEESNTQNPSPLDKEGTGEIWSHSEPEESIDTNTSFWTEWRIQENIKPIDSSLQTPQNDNITQTSRSNPEESVSSNTSFWTEWRIQENIKPIDSSADKSDSEWQTKPQKSPIKEPDSKDDEDLKNRAKIFRSF
jgi:hypothetical protein